MDLGAYAQIEDLEKVAELNNIKVPRLRGYRLMVSEESVNMQEFQRSSAVNCCRDLITASPSWSLHPSCYILSSYTDVRKDYFLKKDKEGNYCAVRWDRIHGKHRKNLKTAIHNDFINTKKQYAVWNKYIGREDVLYIHARIGGGNWPYYYKEVVDQPWFLEKVDDSFDCTYCDIYAKIDPETYKSLIKENNNNDQ